MGTVFLFNKKKESVFLIYGNCAVMAKESWSSTNLAFSLDLTFPLFATVEEEQNYLNKYLTFHV